jgi:hypothetical protein
MRNMVAVPLLGLAVIVQSAIVGQFPLLGGTADLILVMLTAWALHEGVTTAFQWAFLASVMVSLVSRLPWFVYFAGYFGTVLLALMLQRRVWQVPMLAMFSVTFLGTLLLHLLSFVYLGIAGTSVVLADAFGLVTLPSVLLNMLIAIPVFGMMRDLARWIFPSAELS